MIHSKLKRAEDTVTRDKQKSRSLHATYCVRRTRSLIRLPRPIGSRARVRSFVLQSLICQSNSTEDVAPSFSLFPRVQVERREIPFHAHAVPRHVSPIERREKWRPTGSDVSEAGSARNQAQVFAFGRAARSLATTRSAV